jgi:putative transposase
MFGDSSLPTSTLTAGMQTYGIAIDGIHYYSDVFRRFVGATEDGRRRSFIFRRDPRDISSVYFWDPELQRYSTIPYRNTTHPAISIWEFRELRRKLQETGRSYIDEAAILAAYQRLREREVRAVSETKRTRRVRERRPQSASLGEAITSAVATESAVQSYRAEDIAPFEIEEQ